MFERLWARVSFLFAWYDLWVGLYWDRKARKLYILPLPCLGIVFDFGRYFATYHAFQGVQSLQGTATHQDLKGLSPDLIVEPISKVRFLVLQNP